MTFSAQQIAALLGGKITGDANRQVWDVGSIESAKEGQLTFLSMPNIFLTCLIQVPVWYL